MRTVRSSGRISGGVPGPAEVVPGPAGVYLVPGGVPGPGGMYLVPGGVPGPGGSTWSQGDTWSWGGVPGTRDVPGPGVVPGPGGYLFLGGVPGEVVPPCGQTHACKNITFATSLRTVKIPVHDHMR